MVDKGLKTERTQRRQDDYCQYLAREPGASHLSSFYMKMRRLKDQSRDLGNERASAVWLPSQLNRQLELLTARGGGILAKPALERFNLDRASM